MQISCPLFAVYLNNPYILWYQLKLLYGCSPTKRGAAPPAHYQLPYSSSWLAHSSLGHHQEVWGSCLPTTTTKIIIPIDYSEQLTLLFPEALLSLFPAVLDMWEAKLSLCQSPPCWALLEASGSSGVKEISQGHGACLMVLCSVLVSLAPIFLAHFLGLSS